MAVSKTVPATVIEPTPEPISEEEKIAEQLIQDSFPDLVTEPEVVTESEPEIINDFYEALGFSYCKKCGERQRTSDGTTPFCPIAKPNCSGFSV